MQQIHKQTMFYKFNVQLFMLHNTLSRNLVGLNKNTAQKSTDWAGLVSASVVLAAGVA